MKKLLLLALFVCIGSIKISSQVIIMVYSDNKDEFKKNYQFYKNTLGDKYEILEKNNSEYWMISKKENVDYWNQIILSDWGFTPGMSSYGWNKQERYSTDLNMIGENITSITFQPWMSIKSIISETEDFIFELRPLPVAYSRAVIGTREITIKPGTQKMVWDSGDGFLQEAIKIREIYNYENILSNEIEIFDSNNQLKTEKIYDNNSTLQYKGLKIKSDYVGGEFYGKGRKQEVKKNGITEYYRCGSEYSSCQYQPEEEVLFIQGKRILTKTNKRIRSSSYKWTFSKTEFEITSHFNEFDIEPMIKLFIRDIKGFATYYDLKGDFDIYKEQKITATFEPLEGNILAKAYGRNYKNQILIKIDPEKWAKASSIKRWYILYHELGHDFLNFRHGQGGKMMFNYPLNSQITIENFVEDRNYMFKSYFKNATE